MADEKRTVFKFGGAALADGPGVRRVVSIVAARLEANPVVVVSAHSGVTELLSELAQRAVHGRVDLAQVRIRHRSLCSQLGLESELLDRYWVELSHLVAGIASRGTLADQDRDAVLSIGERVSARIVARSLRAQGVFATPVDAFDLGLITENGGGQVRPRADSGPQVRDALRKMPGVPVVTGFLARAASGLVTTLGPNGSDWTASWLAEAIGARELVFWKTVPGFMTADPKLISTARVIRKLAWEDALELTRHGAGVLHPRAIEPARRAGIHVTIRDVAAVDAGGSLLEERASSESPVGLATAREDEHSMRIVLVGGGQTREKAANQLEQLAIAYRWHPSEPGSLIVAKSDLLQAMESLHEEFFEEKPVVRATDREA